MDKKITFGNLQIEFPSCHFPLGIINFPRSTAFLNRLQSGCNIKTERTEKLDIFLNPPGHPSVYMYCECVCAYYPADIFGTSCSVPGVPAAQCISCRFWVSTRCPIQLCTGVPACATWHYNGHDQQTLLYLQQPVTA